MQIEESVTKLRLRERSRVAIGKWQRAAMALVLSAGCGAGVALAQSPAAGDTSAEEYHVQPGDRLHISVWREEELDLEVLVRPDGGLSFPLAGDLNAAGKSIEALRTELSARLERYIPDLSVTVLVQEVNGNKVYVIGQVNQPGEIVMNPRVDVMQALSLAGGLTTFSSPNDVFILRRENGRQRTLPFRYGDVLRGRDLDQNIILRSGDVVVVP